MICRNPNCADEATQQHQLCRNCYYNPAIHRAARNGEFPPKAEDSLIVCDARAELMRDALHVYRLVPITVKPEPCSPGATVAQFLAELVL